MSLIRYKEGEAIYTTVLNSEQQQLSVQVSLVNARSNVAQSLVSLYRSLGGGWQIRGNNDVVPDSIKAEMAARTNWFLVETTKPFTSSYKQAKIKQQYLPACDKYEILISL